MTGTTQQSVKQVPMVCPGHNRGIVELQYSDDNADGLYLISACLDGKPMLRDGSSGDWIGTFDGHKGAVWGACINREATLAATGAAEFSARLWDAITGDCKHVFQIPHICKSVCLSNDSQKLLAAGNMPSLAVFDLGSPDSTPLTLTGGAKTTKLARFIDSSSHTLVSAGADASMYLWDIRAPSGSQVTNILPLGGSARGVKSGEMSRDASTLNVVTTDDKLQCWDMRSLTKAHEVQLPNATESASVHIGRNRIVCGGQDLTVRVLEYTTGEQIEAHRGHHGPVWVLRFAPDGESFASGSDDGTIRIWQTSPKANTVVENPLAFD
mmetsp:Transcript_2043/g.3612  ORF Transcript_2043/g.3612 Transcript_2043/m.3612 type:complete len:325 (-) Transcript_2043:890-1864(-)|eukprot:CAMPEP_0182450308 /NCGR_PEP_ID=MMETSP1172-20130603/40439_1 /TAXON_ID=708627 /ORGANISM="Timspurckia oligopyrenoides, Strain CCMP3278" /LENGTH=324 /DNA_ID=CAMNT_0024647877 /DNA_START=17 /DNA_END=991 /DNA_ORIENTATION=-